jgi:hypothetical protein
VKAIGAGKGAQVVKPDTIAPHDYMGLFAGQVTHIESFVHHEMMNGMGPAEEETKELHRKGPPYIKHLCLLDDIALLHIPYIMQVGGDEVQAELSKQVRDKDDVDDRPAKRQRTAKKAGQHKARIECTIYKFQEPACE